MSPEEIGQEYFSETKISNEGGLKTAMKKAVANAIGIGIWYYLCYPETRKQPAILPAKWVYLWAAKNCNLVKQRQTTCRSGKTKERKLFCKEGRLRGAILLEKIEFKV